MNDFEGKELFDDIIANPFRYINKAIVNVRYHLFTVDTEPTGAFSGVIDIIHHNSKNNLSDTITIQGGSRNLKVQRWAIISIKADPDFQNEQDTIRAIQSLSNRIFKLESRLKSLADFD